MRDSLGRLVELPIDTHPGHYRRETATIHSSAIVRLASQLRKFPPGGCLGRTGWAVRWWVRQRVVTGSWVVLRCLCAGEGQVAVMCVERLLPCPASCLHISQPPLCSSIPLPPPPPGSVLFVEVKHWKSDKKRFSTLAWSYCPLDRLVDFGAQAARVRGRGANPWLVPCGAAGRWSTCGAEVLQSRVHSLAVSSWKGGEDPPCRSLPCQTA